MLQGVKLSKTQNPTMAENRKRMKSLKSYERCEVIKEFVVKVTSVQTFTLIQMTLSLNLDTY